MRSKDLAKASGLAVAFDHTAPTFYRVSQNNGDHSHGHPM